MLEQCHYLGILSFCCFMCILLLLIVVIVDLLSLFFCLSFSVSLFLCLLFCVSPFLCVSFFFCLLFSVSFSVYPFLCLLFCVSFPLLSTSLCLSIPLSVYGSLLLVSVKFSDSKNNPLLDFFRPVEILSPVGILSPVDLQSPVKILPLLEFSPCSAVFHFFVFPSSFPTYSYPFLSINHPSIFPIITYYPKLFPSDNTLPDPPP